MKTLIETTVDKPRASRHTDSRAADLVSKGRHAYCAKSVYKNQQRGEAPSE